MGDRSTSSVLVIIAILLSLTLVVSPFLTVWGQRLAQSSRPNAQELAIRPLVHGSGALSASGNLSSPVSLSSNLLSQESGADSSTSTSNPTFFNPATYVSSGVLGTSVATGDFNGDGKIDLVLANQCYDSTCDSGGVSVMLGNGDGTFRAAQSYASGGYETYSVAVGDLNGDGKPDLVVASGCQSSSQCTNGVVAVLLGNGDGTFKPAKTYSSGGVVASSVAIGDLTGNGKEDVVVANQCQNSSCQNGSVSVLLGSGNGTLGAAQSYASGGVSAVSVAIADFNGDGKNDLAVASVCQTTSDCHGAVGILLGNGNGTFQAVHGYGSGGYRAAAVATGDFNGDGKTDLVVANQCERSGNCDNGNVGVLIGNGDGTFLAAKGYVSGGNNTTAVAVGDLNGDGTADLVVSNSCEMIGNCVNGSVSVLLGKGNGTFHSPQNYISEGVFTASVAIADFTGDVVADLAIANQCQTSNSCNSTVTVLLGEGNGTFQAPPSYASSGGYNADAVGLGDLNGDGIPDLVVANFCSSYNCNQGNNGSVNVLLGNGDGTFSAPSKYPTGGFGSSSVAIADLTGNGNADVVVVNQCGASDCQSGGSVSIFLGTGDGGLLAAQSYPSGGYTSLSVVIGDFNNDGKPDLAVANQCQDSTCQNGSVSVLLGNGDGTFQAAQSYPSAGYNTNSIALGDFNGDGNSDLALASQCQDSSCQNGGVSVLLGNGNGTFQAAQNYGTAAPQADSVAVTDLNGDGHPDLVVSNFCASPASCSNGMVSSLLGKGDGTFYPARPFSSGGQYAYSVVAGNFMGNGNTDVVVANYNGTCVLAGNGDGTFQTAIPYNPGGVFLATGDLNGDNEPDVVVAGGSLSTVTILLNTTAGYRQVTSTTLTSSPNPSSVDQSVLFTASVTNQVGGSPTGTVTFNAGTTVLGTSTVTNGSATLNYAFTSRGGYQVTATYSGDSNFLPSTSAPITQEVLKAATTSTLTSSVNPSRVGREVTFKATVTGEYGGTPTSSLEFLDGGTVLAQVSLSKGVASYKTAALTKGTHSIFAQYGGDANFQGSHAKVTQTVQ